jgi:hypothetical protein
MKMVPHHKIAHIAGTITHVFAHRFVVSTDSGPVLADLTPRGLEQHTLRIGETIALEGEVKPSELKVLRLTVGGKTICVAHQGSGPHHHDETQPDVALTSARDAGFDTIGRLRRKPKHFEVLGRREGRLAELHIEMDGHIRKMKDVPADDHKWRGEIDR